MKKLASLVAMTFIAFSALYSQSVTDSLKQEISKLKKDLTLFQRIKMTGYTQVQYQHAEEKGAKGFAAGNFPAQSQDRFVIRRGRIRMVFENFDERGLKTIETSIQIDGSEKGVSLRDIYGKALIPGTNFLYLQGGLFNRPFGYEIPFSSINRESPERARVIQILFPTERDLGFNVIIEPSKNSRLNFLKLEGGLFNGTGFNASEFDNAKDFIGRLTLKKTLNDGKLSLSGGGSVYRGKTLVTTPNVFYIKNGKYNVVVDSAAVNKKYLEKNIWGLDAQATYKWSKDVSTTFRAEYLQGSQPGEGPSDITPTAPGKDLYLHQFNSAIFCIVQSFNGKHKNGHDFVLKYDWWDPDRDFAGTELNSDDDPLLTSGDVKYSTLGLGYVYRASEQVKFLLYYDMVKNEETAIQGFKEDLKDNVVTVRVQYTLK